MKENTEDRIYYSVSDIAQMLCVHYNTIMNLIKRKKITAVKVANVWRISKVALDIYLNKQSVRAS